MLVAPPPLSVQRFLRRRKNLDLRPTGSIRAAGRRRGPAPTTRIARTRGLTRTPPPLGRTALPRSHVRARPSAKKLIKRFANRATDAPAQPPASGLGPDQYGEDPRGEKARRRPRRRVDLAIPAVCGVEALEFPQQQPVPRHAQQKSLNGLIGLGFGHRPVFPGVLHTIIGIRHRRRPRVLRNGVLLSHPPGKNTRQA